MFIYLSDPPIRQEYARVACVSDQIAEGAGHAGGITSSGEFIAECFIVNRSSAGND
jgi:hypothetical protein